MRYLSYLNNDLSKITNIVMDLEDSKIINNKSDLRILNRVKS